MTLRKPTATPRRNSFGLIAGFFAIAGAILFAVFAASGAISGAVIPGLPDAGALVNRGLPVMRVLLDVLGAVTVGFCVVAAFLVPGEGRTIGVVAYRLLRRAGWLAVAWAGIALLLSMFTVANFLGRPIGELSLKMAWSFLTTVDLGRSYALQVLFALVLAVGCRLVLSRTFAAVLAVLALVTALPPAFTGHAAGAGNHQIAVTGMVLHIAGAALWFGGLVAIWAVRDTSAVMTIAARYSRMALGCFVVVTLSGVANAAVRLGSWHELFASSYGILVLGKVLGLVVLGGFGAAGKDKRQDSHAADTSTWSYWASRSGCCRIRAVQPGSGRRR